MNTVKCMNSLSILLYLMFCANMPLVVDNLLYSSRASKSMYRCTCREKF